MDASTGNLPVDDALAAELARIDSTEWDRERAARMAAAACVRAGRPELAAARLETVARSQGAAGRVAAASATWRELLDLDGLEPIRIRDARVRASRDAVAAGDVGSALDLLEQLHADAIRDGDPDDLARACYLLQSHVEDPERAAQLLDHGAAISDASGWAWQCRARRLSLDAQHEESLAASREALSRARAHADVPLEVLALEGIAYDLGYLGHVDDAATAFEQVAELSEHDGDLAGALRARGNLVQHAGHDLNLAAAREHVEQLRRSLRPEADPRWAVLVESYRSTVARWEGDIATALAHARDAVDAIQDDVPYSITELIAVQALLDAAFDAGSLVDARRGDALEADVARRIGGDFVAGDREWTRLRLAVAEGTDPDARWLAEVEELASTADDWLHCCMVDELALLANWRDDRELAELVRRIRRDDASDRLVAARRDGADALVALLLDGDDRPARVVRRRFEDAGMALAAARLELAVLQRRSQLADMRRVMAMLDRVGAARDLHELTVHLPGLLQEDPVERALRLVPVDRRDAFRAGDLARSGERQLRGDTVIVAAGFVRLLDGGSRLVGVAGPGGWITPEDAVDAGAVSVEATLDAVLLEGPDGPMASALEPGAGSGSFERCDTDARVPVRDRVERVLRSLARRWGHLDGDQLGVDTGLTQDDLASLAGTSRKSATLAISELRRAGVADARRGRIDVSLG